MTTLKTPEITTKVWSLGMSKTGTASIQAALNILSFPSTHGYTLYDQPSSVSHAWKHALRARYLSHKYPSLKPYTTRAQFDALLEAQGHVAVTDVPGICFAEELITLYPESKILLVERAGGIDAWYKSFYTTIYFPLSSPANLWIAWLDTKWLGPICAVHLSWLEGWIGLHPASSPSPEEIEKKIRACYVSHYELVRRITPRERLLEYKLGSGWGPLCEFLQVEIPRDEEGKEMEFPHVNEKEAMKVKIDGVMRQGLMNVLWKLGRWGGMVMIVVLGWLWVRYRISGGISVE